MNDFLSEDDLLTFEGFLKFQAVDPATATPAELETFRGLFEQAARIRETSPRVGQMKLRRISGEQKYAVAIRDGSDLWLTMWVRCSPSGEIFVMYPRGDGRDAHASYHLDGTFHMKSYRRALPGMLQKKQPLNEDFRGGEHLGSFKGHGTKRIGAVCDPEVFDGVVVVEHGILGPLHGSVVVDLAGC